MIQRALPIAWIALPVLFLIALVWEVNWWRSLVGRISQARTELVAVERQIKANEAEMAREMGALGDLFRDMQRWSIERGDPATFLTGLGGLANGKRLKITGIGPLERETTPQFRKAGHRVEVLGPYEEFRVLAARLEREGGILEDVSLKSAAGRGEPDGDKPNEIEARFRVATMELTPESKAILRRTVGPAGAAPAAPPVAERALALPLPKDPQKPGPALRDPFAFVVRFVAEAPPEVPGPEKAPAPVAVAVLPTEKKLPPVEIKGIVSFPGGYLAIVNDYIVKVGDHIDGQRVEQITEGEVVLRAPEGPPRTVRLPSIHAASRSKPTL